MSAVIWLGIVAVWAFVLIPTWVRRSDVHWRRSGEAASTRDRLGRAARVISRSGAQRASTVRQAVPAMRRSASTATRRVTVAATSSPGQRTTRTEAVAMEAETETLTAVRVDVEPPTRSIPVVGRAPSPTSAAAPALDDDIVTTEAPTSPESVPSAQAADAAEPEASMPTPRAARPAPRRSALARGAAPAPPHVQRARLLVCIAAAALATLLLALLLGGWWVLLHLMADVALIAYLRHLRGIAKQQLARKARAQTARAEARAAAGARPADRAAAPRPQRRAAAPRHRADAPTARRVAPAPVRSRSAAATAPAVQAPEVIDLTDDAMSDDCPTTELTAARAV